MSHYQHLSILERECLWEMQIEGYSIRAIARELGRSPSSISRELKRNQTKKHAYSPSQAQASYEKRRKRSKRKYILKGTELGKTVFRLISEQQWSPEEICRRLEQERKPIVSYNTIYRALAKGILEKPGKQKNKQGRYPLQKNLRRKGWRSKKKPKKQKFITAVIEDRPLAAEDRSEIGHYEGDLVYCKQYNCYVVTMVDRKTRFLLTGITPSRSPEDVAAAMIEILGKLPPDKLHTVTLDRGPEFALHSLVTEAMPYVTFYFAHPASPWERGTNENTNGLLRQYIPKRARMAEPLDSDYLTLITDKLNLRPRKCLNWLCPSELFFSQLLHLT